MQTRKTNEKLIFLANKKIERGIYTRLAKALNCEAVSLEDLLNKRVLIPSLQDRVTFYGHSDGEYFGGGQVYYTAEEFSKHLLEILQTSPDIREIDLLACNVGAFDKNGECYASKIREILLKNGYDIRVNTFVVDNSDDSIVKSFFVVGNLNVNDEKNNMQTPDTPDLTSDEFALDILRSSDHELYKAYQAVNEDRTRLDECKLISAIVSAFDAIIDAEMNMDEFTQKDAINIFKKHMRANKYFHGVQDFESVLSDIMKKYNIQFMQNDKTASYRFNNSLYEFKYPKDISRVSSQIEYIESAAKQRYVASYNQCSKMRAERARVMKGGLSDIRTYLKPVMLPGMDAAKTKSSRNNREFHVQSHAGSYLRGTSIKDHRSSFNDLKIFSHATGDVLSQRSYDGEAINHPARAPKIKRSK